MLHTILHHKRFTHTCISHNTTTKELNARLKENKSIADANHVPSFIMLQTNVKQYDSANYVFGIRGGSTHSYRVTSDGRPNIRRYSACHISPWRHVYVNARMYIRIRNYTCIPAYLHTYVHTHMPTWAYLFSFRFPHTQTKSQLRQ